MTAPKFTPGPWHVEHRCGESGAYVVAPSTALISKFYHVDEIDEQRGVSIEANAHLCAAAPELYAALERAQEAMGIAHDACDSGLGTVDCKCSLARDWRAARAALGKAVSRG